MPPNKPIESSPAAPGPLASDMSRTSKPAYFRFLDLPAELRIMVYEFVAAEVGALIKPCGTKLALISPLLRVSHQVRKEFQEIKITDDTKIVAHVKDNDFSLVRNFLQNLSAREMETLPGLSSSAGGREFIIILMITSQMAYRTMRRMQDWVFRVTDMDWNEKYAGLVVTYKAVLVGITTSSTRAGGYPQNEYEQYVEYVRAWNIPAEIREAEKILRTVQEMPD